MTGTISHQEKMKTCAILIFICLWHLGPMSAGDYADVNNFDKDRPFRMGKINAVWEKAKKKLKGKKLTDLYADLVVQDRKFKVLKMKLTNNEDVDGLFEAEARQEFADVLKKYTLDEHFTEEKQFPNRRQEKLMKPDLRDEKLSKLWKKATYEGFSDQEMNTLREELFHHQMKLDEYNSLKTDYDILKDNVDNSLENLDEKEDYWRKMESTKRQMKDKHHEIRDSYKTLQKKVDQSRSEEDGEFSDPRVYHLWALAQKSGMSEAELKSIKKELSHFQHRIQKAEVIQAQVNKSEQRLKSNEMNNPLSHKELVDKAKQYHAKVDKYHEDLKSRIQRRLDEL